MWLQLHMDPFLFLRVPNGLKATAENFASKQNGNVLVREFICSGTFSFRAGLLISCPYFFTLLAQVFCFLQAKKKTRCFFFPQIFFIWKTGTAAGQQCAGYLRGEMYLDLLREKIAFPPWANSYNSRYMCIYNKTCNHDHKPKNYQ